LALPPLERAERAPGDPLDFGLHYPREYVLSTWLRLRDWGEYPNGLPYDAQPARLLADYAALDERYGDIYEKLKADNDWQPETFVAFVLPEIQTPPAAANLVPEAEPGRGTGLMARIRKMGV